MKSSLIGAFIVLAAMAANSPFDRWGVDEQRPMKVDKERREIVMLAEMKPERLSGGWFQKTPGHHAVVGKGGGAAGQALLVTAVDDLTLYNAMLDIGAKPGNNLTTETWTARDDPSNPAPDLRVDGTPVDVSVWWEGLDKPKPLKDLLKDASGSGLDMRFGGNKAFIPVWKSGCIVCLCSCPGGKISNRDFTMRDYAKHNDNFAVDFSQVPEGGRKAVVIIRVRDSGPAKPGA